MTISAITRLAAAACAAAALTASAAPTLTVDHPCYSPGDAMRLEGTGYTPSGAVSLNFTGANTGVVETAADLTGGLHSEVKVTDALVERYLRDDEVIHEMTVASIDRTKQGQGPLEEAVGATAFMLSRWGVSVSQDLQEFQPARRVSFFAVGFTGAENRTLYLHYLQAGRRVATVALGRLRGPCGTLDKTLARAFPMRRVKAGRWRLVFNLSPTRIGQSYGLYSDITVRRRDATG